MARARSKDRPDGDNMPIFEVDGLPYIDADWLERRIYRDSSRADRWRQEADNLGSFMAEFVNRFFTDTSHFKAGYIVSC